MHRFSPDMAAEIGPGVMLVEYGSGSSIKTRLLLDHLADPAALLTPALGLGLQPGFRNQAVQDRQAALQAVEMGQQGTRFAVIHTGLIKRRKGRLSVTCTYLQIVAATEEIVAAIMSLDPGLL